MKNATLKALYQVFERLAESDLRVNEYRVSNIFEQDEKDLVTPTVLINSIGSTLERGANGDIHTMTHRLALFCLSHKFEDDSDIVDVQSDTESILFDMAGRLNDAGEFYDLGFEIQGSPTAEPFYVKGNDGLAGSVMTIEVRGPYIIGECQLPTDPLPTIGSGYSGTTSSSSSFSCSDLSGCSIITQIQADIASISGNTGGGGLAATGLTDSITVGEDVNLGDVLFIAYDNLWYKADNQSHYSASTELRLALENVNSGSSTNALVQGLAYHPTATLDGREYWLSQLGAITVVQTWGSGELQRYIGTSRSNNLFYFNPDQIHMEMSGTNEVYSINDIPIWHPPASTHNKTYVQQGTNITTGGTEDAPTINVDPNFTSLSATTYFSGNSENGYVDIATLITGSGVYVPQSGGTFTGGLQVEDVTFNDEGTALENFQFQQNVELSQENYQGILFMGNSNGNLNINSSTGFTFVESSSTMNVGNINGTIISGGTFYSGSTPLNDLLGGGGSSHNKTYVQQGTNITTGGTEDAPTINVDPNFTTLTASTFYSGTTPVNTILSDFVSNTNGGSISANTSMNNVRLAIQNGATIRMVDQTAGRVLYLDNSKDIASEAGFTYDASSNLLTVSSLYTDRAELSEAEMTLTDATELVVDLSVGHFQVFSSTTATTIGFYNSSPLGSAAGYSVLLYGAHADSSWTLSSATNHLGSTALQEDSGVIISGNSSVGNVSVEFRNAQNHLGSNIFLISADSFSALT
jgi:hypothetical protein